MTAKKKLQVVDFSHTRAPTRASLPEPKATSILDQRFKYTGSAETDLRAKFKALGFKTPKPRKPQYGK